MVNDLTDDDDKKKIAQKHLEYIVEMNHLVEKIMSVLAIVLKTDIKNHGLSLVLRKEIREIAQARRRMGRETLVDTETW